MFSLVGEKADGSSTVGSARQYIITGIKEDSKESNIVSKERPRSIGDKPENKVVKRKRRTAKKKDPE